MLNDNSLSTSVSEDELDELGRVRARLRRKRKKPTYRSRREFSGRLLSKLLKYWMLLVIILAAGLLVFEATRIGRKPRSVVNSQLGISNIPNWELSEVDKSRPILEKTQSNLNRLDPTTPVVGGVRQRCLKLLPSDELEHLDIPMEEESSSSVNKVKEAMMVHCGFFSESGGFSISDEDKDYMRARKIVVPTCAFGGGDNLYQPIGMSEASLEKVCYVAFWDEITQRKQELVGRRIGENGFIGRCKRERRKIQAEDFNRAAAKHARSKLVTRGISLNLSNSPT